MPSECASDCNTPYTKQALASNDIFFLQLADRLPQTLNDDRRLAAVAMAVQRARRSRLASDLVDSMLLAIVVRQAGLAREIAAGIAHFVAEQQEHRPFDRERLAARARRIEEKAALLIWRLRQLRPAMEGCAARPGRDAFDTNLPASQGTLQSQRN